MTSVTLPADPAAAGLARRWLGGVVRPMSASGAEAALLLSELVTDAVVHGLADDAGILVETRRDAGRLRIEVSPSPAPADDPTSRMRFKVIDALALGWGHDRRGASLVAWFEVRLPGAATALRGVDDAELLARAGRDPDSRDEIFRRYAGLATRLSRRFRGKGVEADDLEQVAAIGLVKAISGFSPSAGVFPSYAAATIRGELKRHLRDRAWVVRVPRRVQEAALEVRAAEEHVEQRKQAPPTPGDLVDETGLTEDAVLEALQAWAAYRPASLEAPIGGDSEATLLDFLGGPDGRLLLAEEWQEVAAELSRMPPRTRKILYLRFHHDMTQAEIARALGISQMHVSRLLTAALGHLREASGRA